MYSPQQIAFVRACLERMQSEEVKPLSESALWDICEQMPELSPLAVKVIDARYPCKRIERQEVRTTVPCRYSPEHMQTWGEREGEAIDRLNALLADGMRTIGDSLPDDSGTRYLLASLRKQQRKPVDPIQRRADRLYVKPRYSRKVNTDRIDRARECIDKGLPIPTTELPLTLEERARRIVKKFRRKLLRGKVDRAEVNRQVADLMAQMRSMPIDSFVREARAKLSVA